MSSNFVGIPAYVDVDKLEEALVTVMAQHTNASPMGARGVREISPLVSSLVAEMKTLPEVSVERVLAELIVGSALQSYFQMMVGQRAMELDQKVSAMLATSAPPEDGGVAVGIPILSLDVPQDLAMPPEIAYGGRALDGDDDLGDVKLEAPQCPVGDGEVCESCE